MQTHEKTKQNMLNNVKDKNVKVLTNEEDKIERWREYFKELYMTTTLLLLKE